MTGGSPEAWGAWAADDWAGGPWAATGAAASGADGAMPQALRQSRAKWPGRRQ